MDFSVKIERRNNVARVLLSGEMDVAAVGPFNVEFSPLEKEDGLALLVDLSGLTFIDSSGLHVLVEISNRARVRSGVVEIVALPDRMTRLFELTRVSHLITPAQNSTLLETFDQMDAH